MSAPSRWRRRVSRLALVLLGALALLVAVVLPQTWASLGGRPEGARLARMQASPQWRDGAFQNPQPILNHAGLMLAGMLHASEVGSPSEQLAPEPVEGHRFDTPPASGLRLTWLGHATTLMEIDGARILTDPMWSARASPLLAMADVPPRSRRGPSSH